MIKILKTILILFLILIGNNFANANVAITENPNTSIITDTSIKIEVNVSNDNGGVLSLKGEVSDKVETGGTFISIKSTDEKIVSGYNSTVSFTFEGLLPGHGYSIRVVDSSNNSPYAFLVDYTTTGIGQMSENYKAYLNSKLTVGDTTAIIKYSVITNGDPKNIALKYSTTDKDLNVTEYGPVGEITALVGTDTAPADAEFSLTNLNPDTFYVFWVIDKDTDIKISVNNSFHTLQIGAEPYSVYAGLGNEKCPDGKYCYLAPLGKNTSIDTNGESIADYLKYIFKFGIGLAGLLAVIMLIIGGIKYMGSDSFFNKEEARSSMTNALIGLLIALSSFLILNTLNPDLVNLKLNITRQNISIEKEFLTEATYQSITGVAKPTTAEIVALIKKVALEKSLPPCIIHAIAQQESKFDASAIGHDENNNLNTNKALIKRGKTFLQKVIPVDTKYIKNDDIIPPGTTILSGNLDFEFSHGIGLMQVTFFPGNPPWNYIDKNVLPKDQLLAENSIKLGSTLLKTLYTKYNNDLNKTFCDYNAGPSLNCKRKGADGKIIDYGADVLGIYNSCVTQKIYD